jgi:predicted transcriptional regulator
MNNTFGDNRSILHQLRELAPSRSLTYYEATRCAELQAERLLSLHGISDGPVPTDCVAELPRIRLMRDPDLPASGSAHWDGSTWVLTINTSESPTRQRFSMMHEFKHIIDHPRNIRQGLDSGASAERLADYFAACVLMPRSWVKRAWAHGQQRVESLAAEFDVSPQAMRFRLSQLGLLDERRYRTRLPTLHQTHPTTYFRPFSIHAGASR